MNAFVVVAQARRRQLVTPPRVILPLFRLLKTENTLRLSNNWGIRGMFQGLENHTPFSVASAGPESGEQNVPVCAGGEAITYLL